MLALTPIASHTRRLKGRERHWRARGGLGTALRLVFALWCRVARVARHLAADARSRGHARGILPLAQFHPGKMAHGCPRHRCTALKMRSARSPQCALQSYFL